MEYLLLTVSMLANLGGGITKKYAEERLSDKKQMNYVMSGIISVASCLTLLVIALCSGGGLRASVFTVLTGILFGLVTAVQTITHLRALQYGPMSITSVLTSLSMIIPALSGHFIWNEELKPLQIVGLVLIILCIFFTVDLPVKGEKPREGGTDMRRWLPAIAVTFFCTGGIGILQKWHQNTVGDGESAVFLILAFAVSFFFSAGGALLADKKSAAPSESAGKPPLAGIGTVLFLLMAVCGVCVGLNNHLNLYLSGVMSSAVFFPVVNGGGLILSLVASIVLFRERLSVRKWIGIAVGFAAIIVLCV